MFQLKLSLLLSYSVLQENLFLFALLLSKTWQCSTRLLWESCNLAFVCLYVDFKQDCHLSAVALRKRRSWKYSEFWDHERGLFLCPDLCSPSQYSAITEESHHTVLLRPVIFKCTVPSASEWSCVSRDSQAVTRSYIHTSTNIIHFPCDAVRSASKEKIEYSGAVCSLATFLGVKLS